MRPAFHLTPDENRLFEQRAKADSRMHRPDIMNDRLLSRRDLKTWYGIAGSTTYAWIKDSGFPEPIALGPQMRRWWQSEVVAWIERRRRLMKK